MRQLYITINSPADIFLFWLKVEFPDHFEIIVIITAFWSCPQPGAWVIRYRRRWGLERGGERAVVCRPEAVVEALEGRSGTVVEKYIAGQDRKS